MDLQMSGHVAIVTGSSSGIGSGIARVLAREGVSVVINHWRDGERAEETRKAIEAEGGRVAVLEADVGDHSSAKGLVQFAVDQFGRLDILVNNAGTVSRTPFMETSQEEFDRVMNVNLRGTWNCGQAAAAHMIAAHYGRILNCSSLAAFVPAAGHAVYGASKAAILTLTKVMAGELAPHNILVNAYVPGTFETPMSKGAMDLRGRELLKTIGLRRLGQPEELGHVAAFLVSPVNSFMSGSYIHVNGAKFTLQNQMKPWEDAGVEL